MPNFPKTTERGHDHDVCPSCKTELCGGLIIDWGKKYRSDDPEGYASSYGWPDKLCGSETIGVEIQGVYDGICYWLCRACGHREHRFDPPGRIYDAVERYWARTDIENARA